MRNIVYLPIEIKSRDFLSRLVLSYFLVNEGFSVFIGRKKEIEILANNFYPGIYFGLNTQLNYLNFYKKLKKRKNKIFLFDEEGLVTLPKKTYKNYKANKKILNIADIFFCWGKKQFKNISYQDNSSKNKLFLSGSLRTELLKKKYDLLFKSTVDTIKKKYKKFILIISSYGMSNHFLKTQNKIEKYIQNKKIENRSDIIIFKKYFKFNKSRFNNFIKKIEELSKQENKSFIVRPHPSESLNFYKIFLKNKKNFSFSNKFSIVEWLKASEVVVHDYCTTSFEAYLLRKKILHFPIKLPNKIINKDIYALSSPINKSKFVNNKKSYKQKKNLIKNYIYNSDNVSTINKMLPIFNTHKVNGVSNSFGKNLKSKAILKYYSMRENKYTNFKTDSIKLSECKKILKNIHKIEKIKKINKTEIFSKNIVLLNP